MLRLETEDGESDILTEDLIETRIGVHDRNHFEVKVDYKLPENSSTEYRVETYFFVPQALGINKDSYSSKQFYSDVQAHIRFKTPNLTLAELCQTSAGSVLGNIAELVRQLDMAPKSWRTHKQLSYELRMFGCVARARIRDRAADARRRLKATTAPDRYATDIVEPGDQLLSEVEQLVSRWRELRDGFYQAFVPRPIRETYDYIDEFLSLVVEIKLTDVLRDMPQSGDMAAALVDVRKRLTDRVSTEQQHRRQRNYVTGNSGEPDEGFLHRLGMLKKFVASVLWLQVVKASEGRRIANMAAAGAAGFAMLFAVLATILQVKWLGLNTGRFVVAAVITYMFKDRIKEALRSYFNRKTRRWISDYSVEIQDPSSNEVVGRCREAFDFIPKHRVPENILVARHETDDATIEALAKPEVVFRYEKAVMLHGQAIAARQHLDDYAVNDIMRFAVWQFLMRADDPITRLAVYDAEAGEVARKDFSKVYHLNLVMALSAKDLPPTIQRVRVVFNQKRILRLESVDGDAGRAVFAKP